MELHQRLYDLSLSDLESAELLFKNEKYHLAIFHLLQSVEKMIKSFGLQVKLIQPEDLQKKIRHLPHKIFAKLYAQQIERLKRVAKGPLLIPDMVPPHQRDKREYENRILSLTELYNKINFAQLKENKNIDELEMRTFLEGAKELAIVKDINDQDLFASIKEDFIKTNNHLIQYFSGEKEIQKDIESMNKNVESIVKHKVLRKKSDLQNQEMFQYLSYVWINLSFILSPHEQTTRYPSIEDFETPLNFYNSENELVKSFEELIAIYKESIDKYNKIYL